VASDYTVENSSGLLRMVIIFALRALKQAHRCWRRRGTRGWWRTRGRRRRRRGQRRRTWWWCVWRGRDGHKCVGWLRDISRHMLRNEIHIVLCVSSDPIIADSKCLSDSTCSCEIFVVRIQWRLAIRSSRTKYLRGSGSLGSMIHNDQPHTRFVDADDDVNFKGCLGYVVECRRSIQESRRINRGG
jgi:hypothetical protein